MPARRLPTCSICSGLNAPLLRMWLSTSALLAGPSESRGLWRVQWQVSYLPSRESQLNRWAALCPVSKRAVPSQRKPWRLRPSSNASSWRLSWLRARRRPTAGRWVVLRMEGGAGQHGPRQGRHPRLQAGHPGAGPADDGERVPHRGQESVQAARVREGVSQRRRWRENDQTFIMYNKYLT